MNVGIIQWNITTNLYTSAYYTYNEMKKNEQCMRNNIFVLHYLWTPIFNIQTQLIIFINQTVLRF